jgi:hypothetical protein
MENDKMGIAYILVALILFEVFVQIPTSESQCIYNLALIDTS